MMGRLSSSVTFSLRRIRCVARFDCGLLRSRSSGRSSAAAAVQRIRRRERRHRRLASPPAFVANGRRVEPHERGAGLGPRPGLGRARVRLFPPAAGRRRHHVRSGLPRAFARHRAAQRCICAVHRAFRAPARLSSCAGGQARTRRGCAGPTLPRMTAPAGSPFPVRDPSPRPAPHARRRVASQCTTCPCAVCPCLAT